MNFLNLEWQGWLGRIRRPEWHGIVPVASSRLGLIIAVLTVIASGTSPVMAQTILQLDDLTLAPIANPLLTGPAGPIGVDHQTGLPTASVLGGDRDLTLTTNSIGGSPATSLEGTSAAGNSIFRFVSGALGGSLAFDYPLPTAEDLSFGLSLSTPARIRIAATQTNAGGDLTVSLTDGTGTTASHLLPTTSFSSVTPTYYDYYLDADSFPTMDVPVDFSDIDAIGVTLATALSDVSDLLEMRIEATPTQTVAAGPARSCSNPRAPHKLSRLYGSGLRRRRAGAFHRLLI